MCISSYKEQGHEEKEFSYTRLHQQDSPKNSKNKIHQQEPYKLGSKVSICQLGCLNQLQHIRDANFAHLKTQVYQQLLLQIVP